jgi:hypothetical protein
MLFLVNHFLEWMIMSDLCISAPPVPCHVMATLQELTIQSFGSWNDNMNTLKATTNLIVCQQICRQEERTTETENALIRARVEEENSEPCFHPGSVLLIPGRIGIERLHIEYKRRQWYEKSIRLYEIAYHDLIPTLSLRSGVSVSELGYLCELHGRLSQWEKMSSLLKNLGTDLKNGDTQMKANILQSANDASRWCYFTKVYESCWYLLEWLYIFGSHDLSYRIRLLKDAEDVAERTGREQRIPNLVAERNQMELIRKTGQSVASIEVPTEHLERSTSLSLSNEELYDAFKIIGTKFKDQFGHRRLILTVREP